MPKRVPKMVLWPSTVLTKLEPKAVKPEVVYKLLVPVVLGPELGVLRFNKKARPLSSPLMSTVLVPVVIMA